MPAPTRPGILALAALLGACDDGLTSASPESVPIEVPREGDANEVTPLVAAREVAPAPTVSPSELVDRWWHAAAVTDEAFARRVLFSWTSQTTADRLRRDRQLFDDAQMPEGPTAYVQRLEYLASRDDTSGELAKVLLGHPDLARRRYAWVRPWATRLGIVRPYGDQLIAVTLRPDAIIGKLDPSLAEPWEFHDLDERPVPLARVLADPSRIGAVYHVRRDGEPHFREYVLCNASAIASWSLASPAITEAIASDAAALRELATLADTGLPDGYDDRRAFAVDHYAPAPERFTAVADALDASVQRGKLLHVKPRRRFRKDAAPGLVHIRQVPPRLIPVA
jgi:hypothetical protein